jgi:uncharacterized membrane protein
LKKLLLIILLSVNWMLLFAQSETSVKTIAQLQSYPGNSANMFVSDAVRGGKFHYVTTSSEIDNGVVFKATARSKGYWIRVISAEVFPEWWNSSKNSNRYAIQSALNFASKHHLKTVLISSVYLTDSTLVIPGNTDLEFGTNTVIRMQNGVNKPMFQNKNAIFRGSPIANADSNITIHGKGIIAGGIQTLLTGDSILNATISLNNVTNISISDIRIDTTSAYAIFISSFKNVHISKVTIENRNSPYGQHDDGIHFAGPGKTAYVNDCTIRCTDDAIAILANELPFRYKTNKGGDLSDIHINNTKLNSAVFGIRLLASSANIFDCTIDNTTGTVFKRLLEFGNYGLTPIGGIIDSISIYNTNVNVLLVKNLTPVIYFNQGNYGTIRLSNTVINGAMFNNSIIRVGNGKGTATARNIIITNYKKLTINNLSAYDDYVRNAYLIITACWAISLFYLMGLLIKHGEMIKDPQPYANMMLKEFEKMERTLWYNIATPLMIISCLLFSAVLWIKMDFQPISLQIKTVVILVLISCHFICGRMMNNKRSKT